MAPFYTTPNSLKNKKKNKYVPDVTSIKKEANNIPFIYCKLKPSFMEMKLLINV